MFESFFLESCRVKMKVEVPVSVAYGLYSERESIPRWMTFISSVKVMSLFVCLYDCFCCHGFVFDVLV